MALLENRIGAELFLGLSGERQPPRTVLSLDERPGVNGTEVTDEGSKGRPFTLRSWVDCESYDDARLKYDDYRDLIEDDALEMVQGGVSSLRENFKVKVLDVRVVYAGTIVPGPGGLNPPSLGFLECEWDLLGIPN